MATLTKRENFWLAQVRCPGFPRQHKTFDTRAEGEAWGRSTNSEMDRGILVSRAEAERTTLAAALERFKGEVSCLKACPAQATCAFGVGSRAARSSLPDEPEERRLCHVP